MAQSLYERLGGGDKIKSIADEIVELHLKNPAIKTRFLKADSENLKRLAAEFIASGTGGPETYTGRDMRSAHEGMNVSAEEYLAVVDDVMLALDKHGVGAAEKSEMLSVLYSLKGEIVRL
jgi:hemoglobin